MPQVILSPNGGKTQISYTFETNEIRAQYLSQPGLNGWEYCYPEEDSLIWRKVRTGKIETNEENDPW